MKNKSELYERMVEVCLNPDFDEGTDRSLQIHRTRKIAQSLRVDVPTWPQCSRSKLGQSELVHKIRELREELNWYQHRIELEQMRSAQNTAETVAALREKATEKEKTLLAILQDLRKGRPKLPPLLRPNAPRSLPFNPFCPPTPLFSKIISLAITS